MARRKSIRLRKQLQEKIVKPASGVIEATKRDRRLWPLVSLLPLLLILAGLWRIIRMPLYEMDLEDTNRQPMDEDDLEKIEGIGPMAAGVLRDAGIHTFAQLAKNDPEQLRKILRIANLRSFDPSTWPEQARLAANGDWERLAALQQELQGGLRVD